MSNYIKNIKKTQQFTGSITKRNKIFVNYTAVNEETGEIVYEHTSELKKNSIKKGWNIMYSKDYSSLMIELAGKKNATILWWYFVGNGFLKKDGTIKQFNQSKIGEILKIKRPNISRALRELKDIELIAEIDGELRYNPFIQGVSGQSNEELKKLQNEWEYNIGYYKFDKDNGKTISKYR